MRRIITLCILAVVAFGCSRPDHIEIDQKDVVLKRKGERIVLIGRLKSRRGTEFPDKLPTWESADPDIASIDKEFGLVANKSGKTVAIAKYGDLKAEVPVDVRLVEELKAEKTEVTMAPDEGPVETRVVVHGPSQKVLTDRTLRYSSSDEKVVTVDGGGGLWAHDPGEAVVKAFCDDKELAIKVKVEGKVPAKKK